MKDNPPVTVLLGDAARRWQEHPEKATMLYRDHLAGRLGVSPKERLTLAVVQDDEHLLVSVLLDGGDLTAEQEAVFRAWLEQAGIVSVGSMPERPTTS